jgi:dTDP-4-dehydrorhamnose 3,5-epimerase
MKKFKLPEHRRIQGIETKQLVVHADERGRLMEILKSTEPFFNKFGQVYLTTAYPGVTKAWHFHERQEDNFCVVRGMMKIVCYDDRKNSPTHGCLNEFFAGDFNQVVVKIPPGVYHGFKCISEIEAIVINTVTEVYDPKDPDEYRLPAHTDKIPYDWSRQDG